jgi:hypothetical protein
LKIARWHTAATFVALYLSATLSAIAQPAWLETSGVPAHAIPGLTSEEEFRSETSETWGVVVNSFLNTGAIKQAQASNASGSIAMVSASFNDGVLGDLSFSSKRIMHLKSEVARRQLLGEIQGNLAPGFSARDAKKYVINFTKMEEGMGAYSYVMEMYLPKKKTSPAQVVFFKDLAANGTISLNIESKSFFNEEDDTFKDLRDIAEAGQLNKKQQAQYKAIKAALLALS